MTAVARLRYWIPIKKLPPQGEPVWIYIKDGEHYHMITAHHVETIWHWYPYPSREAIKVKDQHLITHWMKRPSHPVKRKVSE